MLRFSSTAANEFQSRKDVKLIQVSLLKVRLFSRLVSMHAEQSYRCRKDTNLSFYQLDKITVHYGNSSLLASNTCSWILHQSRRVRLRKIMLQKSKLEQTNTSLNLLNLRLWKGRFFRTWLVRRHLGRNVTCKCVFFLYCTS